MHKNMHYKKIIIDIFAVTFREEGVDWNSAELTAAAADAASPSARKVWIEITLTSLRKLNVASSPSARKVWIEILSISSKISSIGVTFREEGVDWNFPYCLCCWIG